MEFVTFNAQTVRGGLSIMVFLFTCCEVWLGGFCFLIIYRCFMAKKERKKLRWVSDAESAYSVIYEDYDSIRDMVQQGL